VNLTAMNPLPPARPTRGFTLIEVTLAVGISALALVGLLAMIPQGVMTMKRATDTAIEARIHQLIVAEIAQTDWQLRGKYDYRAAGSDVRFYDDQGIRVPESEKDRAIYTVRLILPGADNGGQTIPMQLPARLGNTTAQLFNTSDPSKSEPMQLIIMEITSAPSIDAIAKFDLEQNWPSIRTYRSTMTRLVDEITATGN
jgi:uncharacterized protein (TIGR02598 family)